MTKTETWWQKQVAILDATVMPTPPPVPSPGGGAPGSYQRLYNQKYMWTRDQRLWPFFNGLQDAPSAGTQLTEAQRDQLADDLVKAGVVFDQELDYMAPEYEAYATNYQRNVIYGYTREPAGQGTYVPDPPPVVNPADLMGPVNAQFPILVSVNIKDYPFTGSAAGSNATPIPGKDYQPPPYAGN